MEATAKAQSNIALIKYWGKRDQSLILPANNSLSMTLDQFSTTTNVSFSPELMDDILILNGKKTKEEERQRVSHFLDLLRLISGTSYRATVRSRNEMPTASGLASSASGFAALAAASAKALGLDLENHDLSKLARRGSGSACRSIFGGFVEWKKGEREDGEDSYAVELAPQYYWELSMIVTLVTSNRKKVSSREGMKRVTSTSVFYENWLNTVDQDLNQIKMAIKERDFESLGQIAEANALKMHATTLGAVPPFTYWQEATFTVMDKVNELRKEGVSAYFTIDAGPNVIVLCEKKNTHTVRQALSELACVQDSVVCYPGPGIRFLKEGV